MRMGWVCLAAIMALLALPGDAAAGTLLLPNLAALPGELGAGLGGAQVALASSGEALWYNPAGLALEAGRRLTASGSLLATQSAHADGPTARSVGLSPGSVAYAQVLGNRHGYPRFTLGLALAQSGQAVATQFNAQRTGTATSLPPGFAVPGTDVDTTFPDGLTLRDTGEASGALRVVAPVVGLGIAPAAWMRVGLALQVQRVAFSERLMSTSTYSASANSGSATLDGRSQLAWLLAGDAMRVTGSLGVQLELTPAVVLGIALVLPSDTLRGSGRLRYQRGDAVTVDSGSGPVSSSDAIVIASQGVPFRLETPQRLQVGLAFRSDRFLIELDAYHLARQGAYTVLPGAQSGPPSTVAFALPALRTSGQPVLGLAVGMAWAQSERTSLLLALARDPSPVPPDDPLFRSLSVTTVSTGVYHLSGDLSLSLGLLWRQASAPNALVAPPDGGSAVPASLSLETLAVRAGGSVAF